MSWLEDNKEIIEHLINYQFKDSNLLLQAFTRRSYHQENPVSQDNEVLEFIGDRSLDLIITKELTNKFGINDSNVNWIKFKNEHFTTKKHMEAWFTEIKKDLVQTKSLAKIISDLNLVKSLRMGNGEIKQKASEQSSVKENLFEALIGAITIDCTYNLLTIQNVINNLIDLNDYLKHYQPHNIDYISIVKEWGDKNGIDLVSYLRDWKNVSKDNEIPLWSNNFSIDLQQNGNYISFKIDPKQNKGECKLDLAKQIYDWLDKNNLLNQKQLIKINNDKTPISQIKELVDAGKIKNQNIVFNPKGTDNNPIWECKLIIDENNSFIAEGHNKKVAKQQAYQNYLDYLSNK